jgi:hypothetical protein
MRMNRTMVDALMAHADQMATGRPVHSEFSGALKARGEELEMLMDVAAVAQGSMSAVRPSPGFRAALRADLMEAAQQKYQPRLQIRNPFRKQRIIIISAAIGSALSVIAGVVAALLVRNRQRSHHAPLA